MTWNYRVIKEMCEGEAVYRVYEVYYSDDGQIEGWSAEAVHAQGETLAEFTEDLVMMLLDAGRHPVLDMEELRKQFPEPQGGGRDEQG